MRGDTTLPTREPGKPRTVAAGRRVAALVIADCPAEPWRVGEAALFPEAGVETWLGRGPGEGEARAEFVQQRPTGNVKQPPLGDSSLSRKALKIKPIFVGMDPALEVELVKSQGRTREMRINGEPRPRDVIRSGDTLEIRGEHDSKILLYCTLRPLELRTRYPHEGPLPPFGAPDASGTVGESPARWQLYDDLVFAAKAGLHVLLLGPSGSGKELCARTLHACSKRGRGRFVACNAANFTATLVAAELFGSIRDFPEKGMPARPGLFGEADGGTLFLDEIGEMPRWLQAKLLRATDPGAEITPVGASMPRRVDVWVIAATNRPVAKALKFDLAPRLKRHIHVPGLEARREDIALLVQHLALKFADANPELAGKFVAAGPDGKRYVRIDPALLDVLLRWTYTLHTRELESFVTSAFAQSHGDSLELYPALAEQLRRQARERDGESEPRRPVFLSPEDEEQRLRLICDGSYGSKAKAAKALGKSRHQIERLLKKYGIKVPESS